jgi:hypothetical protein
MSTEREHRSHSMRAARVVVVGRPLSVPRLDWSSPSESTTCSTSKLLTDGTHRRHEMREWLCVKHDLHLIKGPVIVEINTRTRRRETSDGRQAPYRRRVSLSDEEKGSITRVSSSEKNSRSYIRLRLHPCGTSFFCRCSSAASLPSSLVQRT